MGVIKLNDMEFYAYHGCFKEETLVGNYFCVDITIETDTTIPELTDNIEDALNYVLVYEAVAKEMAIPSKLVENVAKRSMDAIYATFPTQIKHLEITIAKKNPPLGIKMGSVSVTLKG